MTSASRGIIILCSWWISVWYRSPGYAIKKVMKIAAVVIGLFVAALAYLSYKGLIDVKWVAMENATRSALTNASEQVVHALNNTATQFAAESISCCDIRITSSSYVWICAWTADRVQEGLKKWPKMTSYLEVNTNLLGGKR